MDDSEMAWEALEYVCENHPDAEITVPHVVGEPSLMRGQATALCLPDDLEEAAADITEPVFTRAHEGSVGDRPFVGKVAQKVFRRSPLPVIVVRKGECI